MPGICREIFTASVFDIPDTQTVPDAMWYTSNFGVPLRVMPLYINDIGKDVNMLPVIFSSAASELIEISGAGAKALKQPGIDMQPVKREMLKLNDAEADLVLTACNMLFAALLEYEGGLWDEKHAKAALELVLGRMKAGRANAVIESLFYGPTARLLYLALDRAPIAYSGLAAASPSQNIIDRTYKWTAANKLK